MPVVRMLCLGFWNVFLMRVFSNFFCKFKHYCMILLVFAIYIIKEHYNNGNILINLSEKHKPDSYIGSWGHTYKNHGLGNQLFHYISLYAIGRQLGRKPFDSFLLNDYNKSHRRIYQIFPKLAGHFIELGLKSCNIDCCKRIIFADKMIKYDNPQRLLNIDCKYLLTSGEFYESYRYFHAYQEDIKTLLTCDASILRKVHQRILLLFGKDKRHKLCVHIRRGDFIGNKILLHSEMLFTVRSVSFALAFLKMVACEKFKFPPRHPA